MRIPKKFLIRGKTWQVMLVDTLKDFGNTPIDGLCDSHSRTIYIDAGLGRRKTEVFFHEFIHAVLAEYGFQVVEIPGPVEEMICNIIAIELVERFKISLKK